MHTTSEMPLPPPRSTGPPLTRFSESISRAVGPGGPLRSCQVHEGDLGHCYLALVLDDFLSTGVQGGLHQSDGEHRVATTALMVQQGLCHTPPLLTCLSRGKGRGEERGEEGKGEEREREREEERERRGWEGGGGGVMGRMGGRREG